MKKLRIAQVGTLWETTPPKLYGGTERVVSDLTEELVKRGHDVTLYATGDSKTSAFLRYTYPRAAYRDGIPWENFIYPLDHISEVFYHADEYDIIHVHLNRSQDYVALLLSDFVKTPTVFTFHFLLPTPDQKSRADRLYFLKKYRDRNFISISNAQRTIPELKYVATVHNGLNFDDFIPPEKPGKDLVWIGRFSEEKGSRYAVEVAQKTGLNLILAGRMDSDKNEVQYFKKYIEPYVDGKKIKYIGEVNNKQKIALLKKAKVFLMPIQWNEPFGLTPIEAMAMGVPVIAFDKGPMKEIIMDGKTGFVVKNITEMIKAVDKVDELNRKLIEQYARSHFNATAMAENYEKVYHEVIRKHDR